MTVEGHELHIRSARDIFEALYASDIGVRLAMLQSITEYPDKVLAYGPYNGRDLIEELADQVNRAKTSTERTLLLGALAGFDDARVVALLEKEIFISQDIEAILIAANRLRREPEATRREIFTRLLGRKDSVVHQRVAANALAEFEDLTPEQQIQVALLAGVDFTPPPLLNQATHTLWMQALEGPRRRRARKCLQNQGEPTFRYIRSYWDDLNLDTKSWLVEWGAREFPVFTVELLSRALESDSEPMILTSLSCIAAMGEAGSMFRPMLLQFKEHKSNAVRLAAIRAGLTGLDWREALSEEEDLSVRLAILRRLIHEHGAEAAPELLNLLEDRDWRIRAAATEGLIQCGGETVIEQAKSLIDHPREPVRLAAVQVLIGLGLEDWLEEKILL
jgi:HEAT repeat protein